MANALRSPSELHLRGTSFACGVTQRRLGLLDELDRWSPCPARVASRGAHRSREQLADELARLGCRLLECAASVADVPPLRSELD